MNKELRMIGSEFALRGEYFRNVHPNLSEMEKLSLNLSLNLNLQVLLEISKILKHRIIKVHCA